MLRATLSLWLAGALLVGAAAWLYRARLRSYRRGSGLNDEQVRQIMERGRIELDEPLDLGHIHEEEERFWEETAWDEPEEH